MPRTKIVCTLGPASSDEATIRALIRAGMNVARINYSHGEADGHRRTIELVRRVADEEGQVVAVLADLQGPKFRVGKLPEAGIQLAAGQTVTLTSAPAAAPGEIPLPHPDLIAEMQPGDRLLLDDGLLELQVASDRPGAVTARVIAGGVLLSNKGASLVGGRLALPAITEKDRRDLRAALECGVDYVAQSFVRRASDVEALRAEMQSISATVTPIVAKIEKADAIQNFAEILAVADGVMVARGDLGVETALAEVPIRQKAIIRAANAAAKPVITATQMLESMRSSPRPTRAEASDVANAILDGTDAVMLSAETAIGRYPVLTVETMVRIAEAAEEAFPWERWRQESFDTPADSVTESISQACCDIAEELHAAGIVTATTSGATARAVAHHRPRTRISALTSRPETHRRLALVWGVTPVLIAEYASTDEMVGLVRGEACRLGIGSPGDLLVITAGAPVGTPGKTNMIQVQLVC